MRGAALTPDLSQRPHRPLTEFYSASSERPEYLAQLFDNAAAYYDWISALLAFGTDARYRRIALRNAGLKPGMRVLDVATGTGLTARAALELGLERDSVFGLDPSAGMLDQNRAGIPLFRGFGEELPFGGDTFDFISMGYALRHVESLPRLFAQFRRVLRPGGTILVLEISRPASRFLRFALRAYMGTALPFLVRLRTGKPELAKLLRYYLATIDECVPPERILAELGSAGFGKMERRTFGPMLSDYFAQRT